MPDPRPGPMPGVLSATDPAWGAHALEDGSPAPARSMHCGRPP